ncbi:MAG: hypothetical protein KGI50_08285 [Patescibacteria group bacterium]|nr:hypothetical protein [Patescibacteria group bacterium]
MSDFDLFESPVSNPIQKESTTAPKTTDAAVPEAKPDIETPDVEPAPKSETPNEPKRTFENSTPESVMPGIDSDSARSVMNAIMYLLSHPEVTNHMLLDEFQYREFLKKEIGHCTNEEFRVKIRAFQRFGVYLRVGESTLIRIAQERDVAFLHNNDEKSYIKFDEAKAKLNKPKPEAPKKSKREKHFEKYRKLNMTEEKIEELWGILEGAK